MMYEEILENLCYYDKRNPSYDVITNNGEYKKQKDCFCDNCFYGKTKLALQCLEYYNMLYNQ